MIGMTYLNNLKSFLHSSSSSSKSRRFSFTLPVRYSWSTAVATQDVPPIWVSLEPSPYPWCASWLCAKARATSSHVTATFRFESVQFATAYDNILQYPTIPQEPTSDNILQPLTEPLSMSNSCCSLHRMPMPRKSCASCDISRPKGIPWTARLYYGSTFLAACGSGSSNDVATKQQVGRLRTGVTWCKWMKHVGNK